MEDRDEDDGMMLMTAMMMLKKRRRRMIEMRMVMGISWPAWQIEDQNHDHCRHDGNGPAWQSEWWVQ